MQVTPWPVMRQDHWDGRIAPARLSFFAIYSPPLGQTDETFGDQVVFYYSRTAKGRRGDEKEEENQKLRQIGLAQGMVGFARNFSDGEPIDSVETDKSRVLMHELERDWWVLASIDLTRLPSSNKSQESEYSSREVSPAPLLLQQILTAHRIFSLHHGPSLSDMFVKLPRDKFCNTLDRFWMRFCRNWEVLLHGNPAADVFGGIKLAAGGELGMGVGEEEWGSGEREVLEDLVRQTEGLVDMTVCRFGEAAPPEKDYETDRPSSDVVSNSLSGIPWMGSGHTPQAPQAPDGLIFGGLGAITRSSLRDISFWVQEIFEYGEHAYGVKDNPHRQRRKRRRHKPVEYDESSLVDSEPDPSADASADDTDLRKKALNLPLPHDTRPQMHDRVASHDHATDSPAPQIASHPGIPPPIVSAAEASLNQATSAAAAQPHPEPEQSSTLGISDKWVKYLTFGLASNRQYSPPPRRPDPPRRTSTSSSKTIIAPPPMSRKKPEPIDEDKESQTMQHLDPSPDGDDLAAANARQERLESRGHFLIGYRGDLDRISVDNDDESDASFSPATDGERNLLRTIKVELSNDGGEGDRDMSRQSSRASMAESNSERLRVLVYVHRPFIYVFLFEQRTPSLQMSSFYKDLHQHLRPLHKSLLSSTSLNNVAERIAQAHTSPSEPLSVNPSNPPFQPPRTSPVFDLVYDPISMTLHTSLPNIPEPGYMGPLTGGVSTSSSGRTGPPPWTRLEALNVHSHILNTLQSTARAAADTERTSKTSRFWWVVWLRVPAPGTPHPPRPEHCRTAFLVRKARDHVTPSGRIASRVSSGMFGFGAKSSEEEDVGAGGAGWGSAAALAGGIGIDARRYVESLLSLNR